MIPGEVLETPLWMLSAFLGNDIDRLAEYRDRQATAHGAGKHTELVKGCALCYPEGAASGNVSSGRDIFAERVAAHARGEEPPEFEPPPPPRSVLGLMGDALILPPDEGPETGE